jgi:hypothetical protein
VDLVRAVNDYPIQLFGPGVHLLPVTQETEVKRTAR